MLPCTANQRSFLSLSAPEVKNWFLKYQRGKFSSYQKCFDDLDGEELCSLTEEQMKARCPKKGDVLFNIIHKAFTSTGTPLKGKADSPLFSDDKGPQLTPPPLSIASKLNALSDSAVPLGSVELSQRIPAERRAVIRNTASYVNSLSYKDYIDFLLAASQQPKYSFVIEEGTVENQYYQSLLTKSNPPNPGTHSPSMSPTGSSSGAGLSLNWPSAPVAGFDGGRFSLESMAGQEGSREPGSDFDSPFGAAPPGLSVSHQQRFLSSSNPFSSAGLGADSGTSNLSLLQDDSTAALRHLQHSFPQPPFLAAVLSSRTSSTSESSENSGGSSRRGAAACSTNPEIMVLIPPKWRPLGVATVGHKMVELFQTLGEKPKVSFLGDKMQFCVVAFSRWTDFGMKEALLADEGRGDDFSLSFSEPDCFVKFKQYRPKHFKPKAIAAPPSPTAPGATGVSSTKKLANGCK